MRAIDVLKYLLTKAESEVPEGHRIVELNVPVDIVREIIDAQPEIIRCKDCEWGDIYVSDGNRYCYCMMSDPRIRTADDFCSYAEREEA